jgi:hypothetical protein
MVSDHHLSQRRACRLVGLSRDSYRNPPQADLATLELQEKIVEIAHVRRRFGYWRIHDLLRPEFRTPAPPWADRSGGQRYPRRMATFRARTAQWPVADGFQGLLRDGRRALLAADPAGRSLALRIGHDGLQQDRRCHVQVLLRRVFERYGLRQRAGAHPAPRAT